MSRLVCRGPRKVTGNAFFSSHRDGSCLELMPMDFSALQEGSKIQCLPNENHFHLQHGVSVINNWVNYIFACKITKSLAVGSCPTLQTELILENHMHKNG